MEPTDPIPPTDAPQAAVPGRYQRYYPPSLQPMLEAGRRLWSAYNRVELRRFAGHQQHVERLTRPLRVAHLTDMHVGRVTPMAAQMAAIDVINAEQPDLVVLTGDFVCHGHEYLDQVQELVSRIQVPKFAVLGNHDHCSGPDEVRLVLKRAGAEILDNANTVVELGHERLQLVGIDDAYTGHADIARAVRGMRADLPTLGLSHIAEEAERLWPHQIPLVLSGHTHAGQVALAGFNEMWLGRVIGHRYVHGLYGTRVEPAPLGAVYVGAGIGSSMVPLRFGSRARREVTIFELGLPPGSFAEHHAEQIGLKGKVVSEKVHAKRAAKVVRNRDRRERRKGSE